MNEENKSIPTLHAIQELSNAVITLLVDEQLLQDKELTSISDVLHEAVVELSECFGVMSDQLVAQSTKLKSQDAMENTVPGDSDINTMMLTTQQMNSSITKAVVALQFEDILQQKINHARQRMEMTQNMLRNLHANIEKIKAEQLADKSGLLEILEQCKADVEKTCLALDLSNPAQQQSLKKGDITLF